MTTNTKQSPLGPGNPKKWGPGLWNFMYTIAATYDPAEDNPRAMQEFYVLLKDILPCLKCRSGYATVLARNPFPSRGASQLKMLRWVYNIHTQVQQHANLPMNETFEQIAQRYSVEVSSNNDTTIEPATILSRGALRVDGPISNIPRQRNIRIPMTPTPVRIISRKTVSRSYERPPVSSKSVRVSTPVVAIPKRNVRVAVPARPTHLTRNAHNLPNTTIRRIPTRSIQPTTTTVISRQAAPARVQRSAATAVTAAKPRGCRRCGH